MADNKAGRPASKSAIVQSLSEATGLTRKQIASVFDELVNLIRHDVGPGVRYQTRIGQLRMDLGYQLNPIPGLVVLGQPQVRRWRVHFSIGQSF